MPLEPIIEGVLEAGVEVGSGTRSAKGCLVVALVVLVIVGLLVWADYALSSNQCEGLGTPESVGGVTMCLREDGSYVKPK